MGKRGSLYRTKKYNRVWSLIVALGLTVIPVTYGTTISPVDEFTTISACSSENKYTAKLNVVENGPRSLLVATLDGKFHAIDTASNGDEKWSHVLGNGPLLSSTIGDIEFEHNGNPFRLIPSLDGNLYRYNGHAVEPIPMDADMLLKNNYRMGDDTVVTGGTESRSFGIDLMSGRTIYECGFSNCFRPSEMNQENDSRREIIMVQRHSQVVRAVDPRTGTERWNFTVGEYEVSLVNAPKKCKVLEEDHQDIDDIHDIRVVVPEGYLYLFNKKTKKEDWSRKFDSPITGVWEIREGNIRQINLFSKRTLFGLEADEVLNEPTLYIGSHLGQIYVQHSKIFRKLIKRQLSQINAIDLALDTDKKDKLQIEWKPMEAKKESESSTALVPLHLTSSNVERGFYLFHDIHYEVPCDTVNVSDQEKSIKKEEFNETVHGDSFEQLIILSPWYWWREILIVVICGSVGLNFAFSAIKNRLRRRVLKCAEKLIAEEMAEKEASGRLSLTITPGHSRTSSLQLQLSPPSDSLTAVQQVTGGDYSSRYLSDFDHVRCLGRGGFGVVFEAKNKLDDCNYAVKRIKIPSKVAAREKVKREVKALAKLEHSGIVRFYYSWIEEPPEGWQCEKDKELNLTKTGSELDSMSAFSASPAMPLTVNSYTETDKSVSHVNSKNAFSEDTDSLVFFERPDDEEEDDSVEQVTQSKQSKVTRKSLKSQASTDSGVILPQAYLYIQMQLCKKCTLKDWLSLNNSNRCHDLVNDIFKQIVGAVDYVHSQGLMHRDLKPSNIFFSQDGVVKIGDFGLVTATVESEVRTPNDGGDAVRKISFNDQNNHTDKVGTCLYMSPEQLNGVSYSNKVDIFSLGVIYFELLVPFSTEMERIVTLRAARESRFPDKFRSDKRDLLKQLLAHDPEERPAASEIRKKLFGSYLDPQDDEAHRRRRTFSSSLIIET
ncbi:Eukaryotic translation initiation factor 2-alpha kinase [Halotydeus destructor]|nr:Eukaryotic translation initiation factor 2-alpha kinase [Halotydeus destructor]